MREGEQEKGRGTTARGTEERNREHALLVTANKPETVLYRAPTFSLLLVSHGGISSHTWVNVCGGPSSHY